MQTVYSFRRGVSVYPIWKLDDDRHYEEVEVPILLVKFFWYSFYVDVIWLNLCLTSQF